MTCDYIVVSGSSLHELTTQVQVYLSQGWKCQGGVSSVLYVSMKDGNSGSAQQDFYQALIKES